MALIGFDYDTVRKDITWDSVLSTPVQVTKEIKTVRDLIEILWVLTDIMKMVGRPSLGALQRVQTFSNQAIAILSNRQATMIGLDPHEQIINLNISGIQPTANTPTRFSWVVHVTFKNNKTLQFTI